jgi:hypothetical protein
MRASVLSPVFYFLQEEGQKHEDAEEREAQGAAAGAHTAAEQRGSRRKILKKKIKKQNLDRQAMLEHSAECELKKNKNITQASPGQACGLGQARPR